MLRHNAQFSSSRQDRIWQESKRSSKEKANSKEKGTKSEEIKLAALRRGGIITVL